MRKKKKPADRDVAITVSKVGGRDRQKSLALTYTCPFLSWPARGEDWHVLRDVLNSKEVMW